MHKTICFLFLSLFAQDGTSQDEDGPYRGKYIGDLNTYANQVSGKVYAVNDWKLLLVDFFYNGEGKDTYFWAGESGRSGPQGFIVPDEYGATNVLERYNGTTEFTLTLPDKKRISRIKWFAVFDIESQNVYGDVFVPPELDAPAPRAVGALVGPGASSGALLVLDANTILIPELQYDGSGGEVYFWTGVGPQPSSRGTKIPDEFGYLEPLHAYRGTNVTLRLPGALTVRGANWLALWDVAAGAALAHATLPDDLNVPAALPVLHPFKSDLPNCKQLHRDLQVSWEVFGPQITIELAAKMDEDEYMSFGASGSTEAARMLAADVAVAWFDARLQRGFVDDYNITDVAPCAQVLGEWRGVCPDARRGGANSLQLASATRTLGLTTVRYRRTLAPAEASDREFPLETPLMAVWALGALAPVAGVPTPAGSTERLPGYHRAHSGVDLRLPLSPKENVDDCFPFVVGDEPAPEPWSVAALTEPALRVFEFSVGPSGGQRGAGSRAEGRGGPALAWYVNGQLAPELQLRRGLRYRFAVRGGDDPHSPTDYHPLVVRVGRGPGSRALAGERAARRGPPAPAPGAAGPLCAGSLPPGTLDRRREGAVPSFRAYNASLQWRCPSPPADLPVAPDASWPDLVYYDSFTHPGMGGRIYIVDRPTRGAGGAGRAGGAAGRVVAHWGPAGALTLALLVLAL